MHYLWYDTETAGLNYKVNPVLTIYMAICDENHEIFAELNLKVKPVSMDGLVIEQQALGVNGINLEEHLANPETLTYPEAKKAIVVFLDQHKIPKKRKSYRPCGHNIPFDDDFIIHYLLGDLWNKYVHHGKLDTFTGAIMLQEFGLLPSHLGSLTSLVEHFGLPVSDAHDAKGDVLMNIKVMKKMKKAMSAHKSGMAGVDKNLLSIVEM